MDLLWENEFAQAERSRWRDAFNATARERAKQPLSCTDA
jgi:hypothetical protein